MNKEFLKELKFVYNQIEKGSNLFWSLKDENELIRKKGSTRSNITD